MGEAVSMPENGLLREACWCCPCRGLEATGYGGVHVLSSSSRSSSFPGVDESDDRTFERAVCGCTFSAIL